MAVTYMREEDWPDPAVDPNTTAWSFQENSDRTFPSLGVVEIVRHFYDDGPPPQVPIWAVLGFFGGWPYTLLEDYVVEASGSITLVGTLGTPDHWMELQFLDSGFDPVSTVTGTSVLSGPLSVMATAPAGSAYVALFIKQEWAIGATFESGFQVAFSDVTDFSITSPEPTPLPGGPGDIFVGSGNWWASDSFKGIERYNRAGELQARYIDSTGYGYEQGATTDDGLTVFAGGYDLEDGLPVVVKFDAETLTPGIVFGGPFAEDPASTNNNLMNLKVRGGALYVGRCRPAGVTAADAWQLQKYDFDGNLLNEWTVGGDSVQHRDYPAYDVVGDMVIFPNTFGTFYADFNPGAFTPGNYLLRCTLNEDSTIGEPTIAAEVPYPNEIYDIGIFLDGGLMATTYDTNYIFDAAGALVKTLYWPFNKAQIFVSIDGLVDESYWVSLPANYNVYEGSSGGIYRTSIDLADESNIDEDNYLFQVDAEFEGSGGRRSSAWVQRFGVPPCPPSVWYSFTPPEPGTIEFFIDADGAIINMEVFTGSELANLEGPIASYSDNDPDLPMNVDMTVIQPYWIRVYYDV